MRHLRAFKAEHEPHDFLIVHVVEAQGVQQLQALESYFYRVQAPKNRKSTVARASVTSGEFESMMFEAGARTQRDLRRHVRQEAADGARTALRTSTISKRLPIYTCTCEL